MTDWRGPFEVQEEQVGSGATRMWRCAGQDGGTVILEQLLPPLSRSRRFTEAILEAARACEGVDHGNLAPVIWTQPIDGVPSLAEGRVPGHDVRAIYNRAFQLRASMPIAFSTRVLADAALGFGAAGRAHTLCHGGVAPQNIWVADAGYGVAVHVPRACLINRAFFARPDGPLQGSFTYAAPEQIHGRAPTARTDVFCLGIVLYEMTTGARLFKRRTPEEARAAVLACEMVPPSSLLPGYPPALERIVLRALSRQPSDRWETPEQMARALEREVLDRMGDARDVVRRFLERLFPRTPEPQSPPRPARGSDRPAVRIIPSGAAAPAPSAAQPRSDPSVPPPREGSPVDSKPDPSAAAPAELEDDQPTEIQSTEIQSTELQSTELQGEDPAFKTSPAAASSRPGRRVAASALLLAAASWWAYSGGPLDGPGPAANGPSSEATAPPSSEDPSPRPSEQPPEPKQNAAAPSIVDAPPAGPPGRLELWVEPWATVQLDGEDLGLTPIPDTAVQAGSYELLIVNEDLKLSWQGKVDVKPGQITRLRVDLEDPSTRSLSYAPVASEDASPSPGG